MTERYERRDAILTRRAARARAARAEQLPAGAQELAGHSEDLPHRDGAASPDRSTDRPIAGQEAEGK